MGRSTDATGVMGLKDMNPEKPSTQVVLLLEDPAGDTTVDSFGIFAGGERVGMCQLRHVPSKSEKMPAGFENQIYYEVDELHQNKGYATGALSHLLDEARKIGLKNVIVAAAESNPASQRVIEKNGGKLVDTKPDRDGTLQRKYIIALS